MGETDKFNPRCRSQERVISPEEEIDAWLKKTKAARD